MNDQMGAADTELRGPGEALIAALARRDLAALEACFHPELRFRALVPPGVREVATASEAIAYFRRWFGEAERLDLLDSDAGLLADRLRLRYRFHVVDADGDQVVEQQAYADVRNGRIVALDLLCSGFRPLTSPSQPAAPAATDQLDACGESCATLTPLIQQRMRTLASGAVLEVCADEPEAREGIPAWSRLTGNALLATVEDGAGGTRFYLRKK